MKVKVYMRIARTSRGVKVAASQKPNYRPLELGSGWQARALPTAMFALQLDIPEEIFKHAEQVLAEVELLRDQAEIAAEIVKEGSHG